MTSNQVGNDRDDSQTATGKVAAVCGHFQVKKTIIFSKLVLVFVSKALLMVNKQYHLHQKFMS